LNDTSKSSLAGCDLYSALGAMTEFPQRLINTFIVKELNKYGAYSVKFLICGIPVEIVLDDYFPCNDSKNLLYSRPLTNELWFLLLEKAFAKLYGSYNEIRNVYISEALELMTGMPSYQHNLREINEDELWECMVNYDKKNYIFCAGTYLKENEDKRKNRIFAIVSLYENEQFKIVKLRDHFQNFEWDGMFSEKSKNWTKELREAIGYTKGERSCFYMELQEFIKHFEFLSVCHYHDGWIRNRVDACSDHKTTILFEMTIDQEMELFISVHQKLPRYVGESPEYDISPVEILLTEKLEDNTLRKVVAGEKDALIGKQTTYVNPGIKIRLSEGKYIIRAKIRWVDQREHEFTLSTLSSRDLTLRQIRTEEYPNFLERVFLDAGSRARERYHLKNNCEFLSAWCGPHLWIYAVNKGNKTWNMDVVFQVLSNIKIPKKYTTREESNVIKMEIPPNEQRAVYVKRINADVVEILWNLNHAWK